jgi:hypothetical protein
MVALMIYQSKPRKAAKKPKKPKLLRKENTKVAFLIECRILHKRTKGSPRLPSYTYAHIVLFFLTQSQIPELIAFPHGMTLVFYYYSGIFC